MIIDCSCIIETTSTETLRCNFINVSALVTTTSTNADRLTDYKLQGTEVTNSVVLLGRSTYDRMALVLDLWLDELNRPTIYTDNSITLASANLAKDIVSVDYDLAILELSILYNRSYIIEDRSSVSCSGDVCFELSGFVRLADDTQALSVICELGNTASDVYERVEARNTVNRLTLIRPLYFPKYTTLSLPIRINHAESLTLELFLRRNFGLNITVSDPSGRTYVGIITESSEFEMQRGYYNMRLTFDGTVVN
jgi:hypothetical protein